MTYTGCTVEASEGVPAVSLAENIIAEFDRALDEAQFRLEVIESLRDWVEETSRVRAGGEFDGSERTVFPSEPSG